MGTPREEGFRMLAEWAPHAACWLAWPHLAAEWGELLEAARHELCALAMAIADPDPQTGIRRGEAVCMLVPDAAGEEAARDALRGVPVQFYRVPFGDIWMRDIGPIFVADRSGDLASCSFVWSGWGGKYLFEHDEGVGERVGALVTERRFSFPWALEGGAVDTDGEGTLLTTRRCLIDPKRNPGMGQADLERSLRDVLGVERILWLEGCLENDHTDGHIDTLARFVAPGVVACMEPGTGDDPNREALVAVADALEGAEDARGRTFEVVRVPSPGVVRSGDGALMPASYMNFYIGNRTVAVPTYGSPRDAEAVEQIGRLFPGRRTVGLSAFAILSGGGAFHCITKEQPGDASAAEEVLA